MKKVTLIKPFKYAPDGINVVEVEPGECELPEPYAGIAVANGYADEADDEKPKPPAKKTPAKSSKAAPTDKAGA